MISKSELKKKYRSFWETGPFYEKRSTDKWLEKMREKGRGEHLRTVGLPNVLVKLQLKKRITKEQADSIEAMLKSPDEQNWTVAIMLMKQIQAKKF